MASWNGPPRCTSVSDRPSSGTSDGPYPSGWAVGTPLCRGLLVAAVVAASVLPVVAARSQTEILDRILAIVDGHVIMQSDVRAFIELHLVEIPPGPDQESHVLTHIIERRLILDQVDRVVAEPAPALVDRRFAAVRDRFASPEDLTAVLDRVGLTSDDLRQVLADDVRRDAYLEDRFASVAEDGREQAQTDWVEDLTRRAQVSLAPDGSR